MKPRRLVFLGLGLAALVIAFAIVLNLMPGNAPGEQAQQGSTSGSSAGSTPASTDSGGGQSPTTKAGSGEAAGSPATAPSSGKQGAPAQSADPAKPLEVNTPAPQSTQLVLPTSAPQTALVSEPLPASADAVGKLAAGYPEAALPPMDGSKLTSSSVSPQGTILQTSLVASTASEPLAVKAYYQAHFAPLGFGTADAPASAGSTATWFTRGSDKITLTITPVQGGASYIVYGVLHAGK
ncbi:hypothetical protein [Arthrobacter sp. GMC3]|uniref:hypothetical protein n=1 Tax=Arthrobacter sp. GMC3 TaxID=2058894 RepID=UPI0011B0ED83|nr:hypothetical protein [Arthrobacter sp. GMC3]